MSLVNSMDYSGKDTVLDVVRRESADFFKIVDDPKNWNVQTRCTEWEVRDMVGHMLDVTEGYLTRWEKARKGEAIDTAGLLVMGEKLNEHAQAFRALPREEAISRLKADYAKMMDIFAKLTAGEWGGKWRATVKDGKFEAKPETDNFEGCKAVFSFDPSDFVLTSFQRFPGGTTRGDQDTIDKVRHLFFRI